MTKMNYKSTSNRYLQAHTRNPRWNSPKAYKSHLNSPVTVIKADGTVTVEKPLTSDEINKVNKIKKKRKRKGKKTVSNKTSRQIAIEQELAREHAAKDREKALEEYNQRQKALKPKPVETQPVVTSRVAPVRRFNEKREKPEFHKAETEFKATRTPSPEWLARKAEQEEATKRAQANKKLLPWEGKHDSK